MLPYRQAIGDPKQVMENRQVHETLESCVTTLRRLKLKPLQDGISPFLFIYLFFMHAVVLLKRFNLQSYPSRRFTIRKHPEAFAVPA